MYATCNKACSPSDIASFFCENFSNLCVHGTVNKCDVHFDETALVNINSCDNGVIEVFNLTLELDDNLGVVLMAPLWSS